jgi:putative addiction module component (TIGR02574 family)
MRTKLREEFLLTETTDGTRSSQVAAGHIILGMTHEAHELLQKALALPENERAELAGNLISSLDATVDDGVDAAWQQEVVRRLHEVQAGKVETISWEEVQQRGRTAEWQVSRFDFILKRNESI